MNFWSLTARPQPAAWVLFGDYPLQLQKHDDGVYLLPAKVLRRLNFLPFL